MACWREGREGELGPGWVRYGLCNLERREGGGAWVRYGLLERREGGGAWTRMGKIWLVQLGEKGGGGRKLSVTVVSEY